MLRNSCGNVDCLHALLTREQLFRELLPWGVLRSNSRRIVSKTSTGIRATGAVGGQSICKSHDCVGAWLEVACNVEDTSCWRLDWMRDECVVLVRVHQRLAANSRPESWFDVRPIVLSRLQTQMLATRNRTERKNWASTMRLGRHVGFGLYRKEECHGQIYTNTSPFLELNL